VVLWDPGSPREMMAGWLLFYIVCCVFLYGPPWAGRLSLGLVISKGEKTEAIKSGIWTLVIGGCAAGAAFGVVRLLDVQA
jgi:hypothetical protein